MPPKLKKSISKIEYEDTNEETEEPEDSDIEVEEDDEEDDNDELNLDQDTVGCNIDEAIEDDNEYFNNNQDIEIPNNNTIKYLSKENRVSANKLTRYEMVRILGERTKQLNMGAKPLIENYEGLPYDKIAEEEFKRNMTPYDIIRPLPNGKDFEKWTLDELRKDHLLYLLEE